ncbi:MAG: hypothetical protein V3U82_05265 [Robiginitomaculum sp.]
MRKSKISDDSDKDTDTAKKQWQAEQERLDYHAERAREKDAKTKARKANAAKRKIARLAAKLSENDDLSEWESEFAQGVTERLETFDSAFADPEKGGRSEALSYAQKAIVSQLKKKAKRGKAGEDDGKPAYKPRSSFKSKKPKYTPRVRQLDEDYAAEMAEAKPAPKRKASTPEGVPEVPMKGKPFLRIVKNED